MAYNLLEALNGFVILKVAGVGDRSRCPLSLVLGVVDHRSVPLALVGGIRLHGPLPLTTSGSVGTLGVSNGWANPVTVLVIIPLLGLFRVGVRDILRFVVEPTLRLDGILINNFVGSVFIPVSRLYGWLDYKETPRCER